MGQLIICYFLLFIDQLLLELEPMSQLISCSDFLETLPGRNVNGSLSCSMLSVEYDLLDRLCSAHHARVNVETHAGIRDERFNAIHQVVEFH